MKALHGPGYVVGDPGNRIGKHGDDARKEGMK
jgi:hypothetical protein